MIKNVNFKIDKEKNNFFYVFRVYNKVMIMYHCSKGQRRKA